MTASDWSSVAASWEAHAEDIEATSAVATGALLAAAAIAPGEDVLELSAGTGHLAAQLAGLVGPEGSLVASDVAPAFVAVLGQRLADVPNASVATIDAAAIAAPAASCDAVVCRMGLMFVIEPIRALRESAGSCGPGVGWQPLSGALRRTIPGWPASASPPTMTGLLSGPPPTEPGGPFSLGNPDELEKFAREAGFTDIRIEVVSYSRQYTSDDELFDMVRVLAPPIAAALEIRDARAAGHGA